MDSTWFNVFSHGFIAGSPTPLARPGSLVLTETLAKKIFGEEDPLQKVLTLNNQEVLYEVTAVVKDIPHNSHLYAEAFVLLDRTQDFSAQHIISPPEFVDNSAVTFVKFREDANPDLFLARFDKVLDQYVPRIILQPAHHGVLIQGVPLQIVTRSGDGGRHAYSGRSTLPKAGRVKRRFVRLRAE